MAQYTDARQTKGFAGLLGNENPLADVIKGWLIRNSGINSDALNSFVPFVQLIGLYNVEEIARLTQTSFEVGERRAVYVDDGFNEIDTLETIEARVDNTQGRDTEKIRQFEEKIESKYIWLNINGYSQSADGSGGLIPGIVLATNQSQVGDLVYENYVSSGLPKDSGGVGITDFQMETGTKEFGNRRYKIRITVTDPQILNDQPEYLKLSNLQSTFLLIYGWSNPNAIDEWEEDSPPSIHSVTADYPNGRMDVDVTQEGTGGAWSAAVVHTTLYDFAFNEIGQLEASFTFMPKVISFLSTYRVPVVGDNMKLFLGTGEQTDPIDIDTATQQTGLFAGYARGFGAVAGELGRNIADVIYEEQLRYQGKNEAISGLFDNLDVNFNVSDVLRNFSEKIDEWGEGLYTGALFEEQKVQESRYRFPYAGPGIRNYVETKKTIANPDDINTTIETTQLNSKIVYYYLGWVLEAMRFSLWDLNKNRVLNSQNPFDVRFKYATIPEHSYFNLAFQDTLRAGTPLSLEEVIQEALKNFKKLYCPYKRLWDPITQELNLTSDVSVNLLGQSVNWEEAHIRSPGKIEVRPYFAQEVLDDTFFNKESHGGPANTPGYQIIGNIDELGDITISGNKYSRQQWEDLTDKEKLAMIPDHRDGGIPELEVVPVAIEGNQESQDRWYAAISRNTAARTAAARTYWADYRKSLVEDNSDPNNPGVVRIMHPDFEGQLLYRYKWLGDMYIDFDRPPGSWRHSDIGLYTQHQYGHANSQERASGGDGPDGFLFSKIKNFYFGEIVDGNTARTVNTPGRDLKTKMTWGVIACPAISARYFSPAKYEYAQQRWYNKHIRFLHSHFETIIRNRLTNVFRGGETADSIFREPVDLFWLTGVKYDNPDTQDGNFMLPPKGNGNDEDEDGPPIGFGAPTGSIEQYRVKGSINQYTHEELIRKDIINRIIARPGSLTEAEVTGQIEHAIVERDRYNRVLNGTGENILDDRGYISVLQALSSMDNNLNNHSIGNIGRIEDNLATIIKTYEGLNGVKAFWNTRIDKILVDLYNNDLISLDSFTVDNGSSKTNASENSVNMQIEESFRDKIENKYKLERFIIGGTSERTYGNLVQSIVGYEVVWFDLNDYPVVNPFNGGGDVPTYFSPVPAAALNGKTARQLFGETTGKFARWYPRYKRCVAAQWQDPLTNKLISDNVENIGEIKFEFDNPGIDYIFMNYVDEGSRNEFVNGHKMYEAALEGDQAARPMEQGYRSYLYYIRKRRGLIKEYLKRMEVVDKNIIVPEGRYDLAVANVDTLENQKQQIVDFNIFLSDPTTFNDKKQFSPFAPRNINDRDITLPIGGGRFLTLEGLVAQYWSLRFDKRTVQGAADITNYWPNKDGTSFGILPGRSEYGWDTRNVQEEDEISTEYNLMPANFTGVKEPYKILDVDALAVRDNYLWNENRYDVRGVRGEDNGQDTWQPNALLWGPPEGEAEGEFSPSNMFYSPLQNGRDYGSIDTPELRVEHLVRSGFVDTELIKDIALDTYGWDSVGFADDDDVEIKIVGRWPMIKNYHLITRNEVEFQSRRTSLWNGGGAYGSYTGPMYLVDDDLDFVGQMKDFKDLDQFDNAGFWEGWHAEDWVKLWYGYVFGSRGPTTTGRFAAWPDGYLKIYPNSTEEARLDKDYHLPNLNVEAIRRISKDSRTTPKQGDAEWSNFFKGGSRPSTNNNYPYGIPYIAPLKNLVADSEADRPDLGQWADFGYPNGAEQYYANYQNVPNTGFIPGKAGSALTVGPGVFDDPQALGIYNQESQRNEVGMNVNTILNGLGDEFERGFFTSVKWANEKFEGGQPLNSGLEKFIVTELMQLFQQGRRIAVNGDNLVLNNTVSDVTYGDLFVSDEGQDMFTTTMADFSRQTIKNVAEIPIKREVVDNLLNRRNANMSLLQFMQQILSPSSIALAGNVHIGVRMDSSNVMELIPASISYKGITNDMFENALEADINNDESLNTYLVFDYKKRNSLIENIDMSSKMDPAAFLTYQNSSDLLRGRDFNVLKLLSYEGVAEDFKEYLENTPKVGNSGETYTGIISISENNRVSVNKSQFTEIPSSIIDGAVAQNPERWARIIAIMQGNDNFTTELLAFYMRGVTLTIHGTTNIQPFNLINVTGVMPDLEGIYIVTNITEKVTPTTFQTIIEGKLLKRKRVSSGDFI